MKKASKSEAFFMSITLIENRISKIELPHRIVNLKFCEGKCFRSDRKPYFPPFKPVPISTPSSGKTGN